VNGEMTKTEAYGWIKRHREGLRDLEAAIRAGDRDAALAAMTEATAPACEVETALHGAGIRGVA
jgi:hypothetical protein